MSNRKTYTAQDHTWIVCAFRESPFLEECIRSLMRQTVRSRIQVATSTPCEYISRIAEKYGCEVFVNHGEAGISGDWNFALESAGTELRTIAHQDDLYEPGYTEEMLRRMNGAKNPLLYFSDYAELRNGEKVTGNRLLRIKRLMLIPVRLFPGLKAARRCSLAFGNAICCPSITYVMPAMDGLRFENHFKSNLDWEMTEKLTRKKGSFVYSPRIGMCHRIHGDSTTTAIIGDHQRTREDYEMMKKFWPDGIAKRLSKVYAASEDSNRT